MPLPRDVYCQPSGQPSGRSRNSREQNPAESQWQTAAFPLPPLKQSKTARAGREEGISPPAQSRPQSSTRGKKKPSSSLFGTRTYAQHAHAMKINPNPHQQRAFVTYSFVCAPTYLLPERKPRPDSWHPEHTDRSKTVPRNGSSRLRRRRTSRPPSTRNPTRLSTRNF